MYVSKGVKISTSLSFPSYKKLSLQALTKSTLCSCVIVYFNFLISFCSTICNLIFNIPQITEQIKNLL